jgi:hypothetical protein
MLITAPIVTAAKYPLFSYGFCVALKSISSHSPNPGALFITSNTGITPLIEAVQKIFETNPGLLYQ